MYLEKMKLKELGGLKYFFFEEDNRDLKVLVKKDELVEDDNLYICYQVNNIDEKYIISGDAIVYREKINPYEKKYLRLKEAIDEGDLLKQQKINTYLRTLDILEQDSPHFNEIFKKLTRCLDTIRIDTYKTGEEK